MPQVLKKEIYSLVVVGTPIAASSSTSSDYSLF